MMTLETYKPTAEQAQAALTLRERAYLHRFNPDDIPPEDETVMELGGIPVAARGNLTAIQGKSKVGKSAVFSAMMGATLRARYSATGDTLCFEWTAEGAGALIHLDTEQSKGDWHALVSRAVTRSGVPLDASRLVSLPLVLFSRGERLEILRQTLDHEASAQGGIDAVFIDGIADLCTSPNDEAEALQLVSEVHALAQTHHCAIICGLHENPGTGEGKTRGHLGSELNRKAFANLRIDKHAEMAVSTIYGTDMRRRDIPQNEGFCFGWNDEAGMHTFQGRAAGLKAAQREEKAATEARAFFEPIYERAAENGTKGSCPVLSAEELTLAQGDTNGTGKPLGKEAMKKRAQRAESIGVLRKLARGGWTLNPNGTNGT